MYHLTCPSFKRNTLQVQLTKLVLCTGIATFAIFGHAEPQTKVESKNHIEMVSKRQTVDLLLQEAYKTHKSPARISTAGYTAKMPSNIDSVTEKLLTAYALEPYRTDLLISAANAQTYNNDISKALSLFKQAAEMAPEDKDILTYLAVWSHALNDTDQAAIYMKTLTDLHPMRAAEIASLFTLVKNVVDTPLKTEPTQKLGSNDAIVTLGYALNPDGTMHDILIQRLTKTLNLANTYPESLIILTGGVPQNGQTEGKLMADWLIKNGINPDRIIEENYATTTVENALYSAYALARHQIKHATIISSASHLRRGQVVFEIATDQSGPTQIQFDTVGFEDTPLTELAIPTDKELYGIYRDALRTMGLWSYRSSPLLER